MKSVTAMDEFIAGHFDRRVPELVSTLRRTLKEEVGEAGSKSGGDRILVEAEIHKVEDPVPDCAPHSTSIPPPPPPIPEQGKLPLPVISLPPRSETSVKSTPSQISPTPISVFSKGFNMVMQDELKAKLTLRREKMEGKEKKTDNSDTDSNSGSGGWDNPD